MESNKEVISKLKFISKIGKGNKINVKYMYVQQDDVLTKLMRTLFHKDNRNNALAFITSAIDNSFEIIKTSLQVEVESKRMLCLNIFNDIKGAKKGIININASALIDAFSVTAGTINIYTKTTKIIERTLFGGKVNLLYE